MTRLTESLMNAIDSFEPHEERERARREGDQPTCVACGGNYHVESGDDPTAVCHACAHELLTSVLAEIREHRAAALTADERETLRFARSLVVSSEGYAPHFAKDEADEHAMLAKHAATLTALDKLLAGSQGGDR